MTMTDADVEAMIDGAFTALAARHPEATSGDVDFGVMDEVTRVMRAAGQHWLDANTPPPIPLPVGSRWRLTRDVERFPHFIAAAGLTGAIESDDGEAVYLKLDAPLDGAEDWDNCVQWVRADGDNPLADMERMTNDT